MYFFLIVLLILVVVVAYFGVKAHTQVSLLQEQLRFKDERVGTFEGDMALVVEEKKSWEQAAKQYKELSDSLADRYDCLLGQKKSSEVRLGQISESLAPFLDSFKYNPESCRFIGMPIDYIVFDLDNECITFLEIKSGQSQLTSKQRKIKEIVEAGKVKFDLYRINKPSQLPTAKNG